MLPEKICDKNWNIMRLHKTPHILQIMFEKFKSCQEVYNLHSKVPNNLLSKLLVRLKSGSKYYLKKINKMQTLWKYLKSVTNKNKSQQIYQTICKFNPAKFNSIRVLIPNKLGYFHHKVLVI